MSESPSQTKPSSHSQELSRSERRKQRTRRALMNAAQVLVREQGYDNITIQDITDAADVGLGTFYNYFESKNELFEGILQELNDQFLSELDEIQAGIKDPAFRFVLTLRHALDCIIAETPWAWFLVQSGLPSDDFIERNSVRIEREIKLAADAGRFEVDDPRFALLLMRGMSTNLGQIERFGYQLNEELIAKALRYALRMLGMANDEAAVLASMPMPERS